ncbi:hypothetical protein ON010_g722 [Phytophthora cinnamomi]|nr:hypothetical protein ON010_g722 [Phytophthora cinnamomi]
MDKWLLLLVVILAIYSRGSALASPTVRSGIKLSELSVADGSVLDCEVGEFGVQNQASAKVSGIQRSAGCGESERLLDTEYSFETLRTNKVMIEEYAKALGVKMSEVPQIHNADVVYPAYGKVKRYGRYIEDAKK